MPGPFPGMDPYLENPYFWRGAHNKFITHLADSLNTILPPKYIADADMRLYVIPAERGIYPDVAVMEIPRTLPRSGTATAVLDTPPWIVNVEAVPIREAFVEIRETGTERLVTAIEVLSPTNKEANSEGRRQYLQKQREVLESDVHLIEIDLLRSGEHTVAPPREILAKKGRWNYLVSLHRAGQGGRFEVWPCLVNERLPPIRVPLAEGDPDIILDLQAVFDEFYDDGAYARRIDYTQDPVLPLEDQDVAWADALLREKQLR